MMGKKKRSCAAEAMHNRDINDLFAAAKNSINSSLSYFDIPLSFLRLDIVTGFSLYLKRGPNDAPFFFRGANLPFRQQQQARLVADRFSSVYVSNSERSQYLAYIESNLVDLLNDPDLPPLMKTRALYDCGNGIIGDVIRDPASGVNVSRIRELVEYTVNYLGTGGKSVVSMLEIMATEYRICSHSVNVFIFGTALGKRIGLSRPELEELGIGLLLHDVGKTRVSRRILEKKDELTPEDWQEIKKHPLAGVEMLSQNSEVSDTVLAVVKQHHEQCSGDGYPQGLGADDIHYYAKIAMLADVFDAITTNHTYKQGASTFKAIRIMQNEMAEAFNPELLRAVVLMLAGE